MKEEIDLFLKKKLTKRQQKENMETRYEDTKRIYTFQVQERYFKEDDGKDWTPVYKQGVDRSLWARKLETSV